MERSQSSTNISYLSLKSALLAIADYAIQQTTVCQGHIVLLQLISCENNTTDQPRVLSFYRTLREDNYEFSPPIPIKQALAETKLWISRVCMPPGVNEVKGLFTPPPMRHPVEDSALGCSPRVRKRLKILWITIKHLPCSHYWWRYLGSKPKLRLNITTSDQPWIVSRLAILEI